MVLLLAQPVLYARQFTATIHNTSLVLQDGVGKASHSNNATWKEYMTRTALVFSLLLTYVISSTAQRLLPTPASTTLIQDFSGKPSPKWEHGLFISYEYDSGPASVSAYDRSGHEVTRASIAIAGASRIILRAPAASSVGSLAIAGSAWSSDGVGAAFIAWISKQGGVDRVVRTAPFAAGALAFEEDGTLWALGKVVSQDPKVEVPHDVLRRYDQEGRLLASTLPRSSFQTDPRYGDYRHPAIDGLLTVSGGVIGIYSRVAREWVEVSSTGAVLGRWPGLDTSNQREITGVARLANGRVCISSKRRPSASELYELDRTTRTWTLLDSSPVTGGTQRLARIYGGEDDTLLISAHFPNFQWFKIE